MSREKSGAARVLWWVRASSIALGAVLVGVGAWVLFHNTLRDEIFPKRWAEVEPGLYRSGQISAGLIRDTFLEYEIGAVVDLAEYEPKFFEDKQAEERIVEELGIEYTRLPLNGHGTGDIRMYALAIAQVDRARRAGVPVLVHCAAGSRRSAGVVAAYQVLVRDVPPEEAYAELDRYGRPVAEAPLLPYLNENMAELAAMLVELGVIDRVPEPVPQFSPRGVGG